MGLLITLGLGIFVLIGAAIAGFAKNERKVQEISISVALGAIAALLICDLLPETIEGVDHLGVIPTILAVALGFAALVLLDRFLPDSAPAHCKNPEHHHEEECALHISVATAIALTIHNIIEGMSVFGVATQSVVSALLLAFGIGIHNIPMGMVVYSGVRKQSPFRRFTLIIIAAISTFIGGLIMFSFGSSVDDHLIHFMIALTVGLLLYILFMELIPRIFKTQNRVLAVIGIIVGTAIVIAGIALSGFGGHAH